MTGKDKAEELQAGFEFVCQQARLIAMMPIDEWLEALEHAEAVAPIIDPTLFRDYLYSRKPVILKKVLHAALELKRVMEEIQPDVLAEMAKEERRAGARKA